MRDWTNVGFDGLRQAPVGEEVYLSVADVSRLLGRSQEMIRRWCRTGVLRARIVLTARNGSMNNYRWNVPASTLVRDGIALSLRRRRGRKRTKAELRKARALIERTGRMSEGDDQRMSV